jgi:hypothetical protein
LATEITLSFDAGSSNQQPISLIIVYNRDASSAVNELVSPGNIPLGNLAPNTLVGEATSLEKLGSQLQANLSPLAPLINSIEPYKVLFDKLTTVSGYVVA